MCRCFWTLHLFNLHRRIRMKMEQAECSETLAYKIQTPGELPRRKHTTWNRCVHQVTVLPAWASLCCCSTGDQAVIGTLTLCSLLSSCSSFRDSTYADHDPLGHAENHDDTADLNGIDKIFEGIEPASSLWLVFSLFAACLECPTPVFCCMPARHTQKCITFTSSWNVMVHGGPREGKWRGNWRMEWVASTIHTTSEHGVSSITTADAHTSAASIRLNWRPCRFKWTSPSRRKMKSGFCTCAITFQLASTFSMLILLTFWHPNFTFKF